MTHYSISPLAYLKIILHAAKHPAATIVGILVGTNEKDSSVFVVDVIPLLHHWSSLSCMMEAGLELVSHPRLRVLPAPSTCR